MAWPAEIASTLTFDFQSSGVYGESPVAATLSARDYKSAKDLAVDVPHPITLTERGRDGESSLEWRQDGTSNAVLTPGGGRGGMGVGAVCATGEVFHTLRADGFDASEDGTGRGGGAIAFHANAQADHLPSTSRDTSVTDSLTCSQSAAVATTMQVRRLTPTECERLQGFPDGYTAIPYRNKPAADGPRYKALGNSMAVPVMRWIGQRIAEVNSIISLKEAA